MKPLYTLGYARLTPPALRYILDRLHIDRLVDVRKVPFSRRPGFSRAQLQSAFPEYIWKGDTLGGVRHGRSHTTTAGIDWIAAQSRTASLLLMCLEHAPGDCHRHDIAAQLYRLHGIDARHIYEDHYALATDLTQAIAEDRECETFPLFS